MPALVRELGASPVAVSWLLTAYLVAASVATPLIGRLGDLYGRGRMLSAVMVVFIAGSIVCALGDSLALLVGGRILQGAAGGVFPLAYGIIRDTFPDATRMRAIGTLSVSLGVGAALGPALAGVIVDHAGPSAIFWIGLPGALPGAGRRPSDPRRRRARSRPDRLARRRAPGRRAHGAADPHDAGQPARLDLGRRAGARPRPRSGSSRVAGGRGAPGGAARRRAPARAADGRADERAPRCASAAGSSSPTSRWPRSPRRRRPPVTASACRSARPGRS